MEKRVSSLFNTKPWSLVFFLKLESLVSYIIIIDSVLLLIFVKLILREIRNSKKMMQILSWYEKKSLVKQKFYVFVK